MLMLKDVVPWGRDLAEYCDMFALTDDDLTRSILGCSDGPASFNAEMARLGHHVVSVDPLYQFTYDDIAERVGDAFNTVCTLAHARHGTLHRFNDNYPSIENVAQRNYKAMHTFFKDFREAGVGKRYVVGMLPELPFDDNSFDLALCGHYLFMYGKTLSLKHHIEAIRELLRVAREVRLYPLVDFTPERSHHVDPVIEALRADGHRVNEVAHGHEFLIHATHMLQVYRR